MITISIQTIYYVLGIVSILCGAAYKLGYELRHITKEQMTELIEFYSKQDNG